MTKGMGLLVVMTVAALTACGGEADEASLAGGSEGTDSVEAEIGTEHDESSTPRRANKAGLTAESETDGAAADDDSAALCGALGKRESCEQCCRFGAPDPIACVASAACAEKPSASERAAAEDCRSTGCAEGETCTSCWSGYTCLPGGSTC